MKQIIVGAFLAAAVSCTGGTETTNPATLADFSSSACKSREGDPSQQALVLESDAEGLQCVEWAQDASGSLDVRLLNFPEPCGEDYLGTAKTVADGSLELVVHKSTCDVFRCGTCLFDFAYTLAGIDTSQPLSIHLGSATCASEPTTFTDEVTLPVDEHETGVVCRYVTRNYIEQYGDGRNRCGERNMPCGTCDGRDTTTCATGLTCAEVASDDTRCLESCSTSDDCAGGLTTCDDGLCRPSASW